MDAKPAMKASSRGKDNRRLNYVAVTLAEFIGTFCLLFVGTGAIIVNDTFGGFITHAGIAVTFGLIVFLLIIVLGDVSGAHLNPAVTLGLFLAGRFPGTMVLPYVVSQLGGAVFASALLGGLFPHHATLGGTMPSGSVALSLLIEILITAMLMFVILHAPAGDRKKRLAAAAAIGFTIALAPLLAGPVSGASMNPARSLGPALVKGHLAGIWIYLAGPVAGAYLGGLLGRFTRKACCQVTVQEM